MVERRIAARAEIPDDGTLLFTVRDGFDEVEALLVTDETGTVRSWTNYCQHWTDVRLDTGGGALVRSDEVVCQKHGAYFETDSGRCTFGPCEGAVLDPVAVDVRGGDVYLTDEDYEFVRLGPSSEHELSTRGGLDF